MKHTVPVLLFFALVGCQSQPKIAAPTDAWAGPMQNMAADIKKLLPFLYDKEAYKDPSHHDQVLAYLRELAQAAHHVQPQAGQPILGDDLLIQYSLTKLKEDLNRAAFSFHVGQKDFSRMTAKASLNHCFRCHSVTGAGGTVPWNIDVNAFKLQPLEKADLLVATRKSDQALEFMEQMMNSGEMQRNYAFDFESLLRRYLALMIRVAQAPDRALANLDRIVNHHDTPHYILEQARGWRASLKTWAAEKKPQTFTKPAQLFNELEARFRRAEALQHYAKDHAGDVEYLRATAILHQGMKILPRPGDQVRALYLLGKAYEVLDELGSWNLHESYYEACLVKAPKSDLAKACFNRLEASLYMGYSGTSGTHLPPEERARLQKLKELLR